MTLAAHIPEWIRILTRRLQRDEEDALTQTPITDATTSQKHSHDQSATEAKQPMR
jgi:hypothetical protein